MNAHEIFEQHGLSFESSDMAMESLNELDIVELWDLAEALMPDNDSIESTGDEDTDSLILRKALINALENGADSLTQEDFDRAREQVSSLEADAESDEASDEDAGEAVEASDEDAGETSEDETSEAAETTEQPKRRGRRASESYGVVKRIVSDNHDLVKDEVIEQAQADDTVDVSESTLVLYFYRARKELGLGTNGQRGRPKSDKWPEIVALVSGSGDTARADVIAQISTQFDVAESTATNYYHKAQRELAGE
jgi:hypothetical protein